MSGSQGGYQQSGGPQSLGAAPTNPTSGYKPPSSGPAAWGGPPGYNINPPQKFWGDPNAGAGGPSYFNDNRLQPAAGGEQMTPAGGGEQMTPGTSPMSMMQGLGSAAQLPQKAAAVTSPGYGFSGGQGSFGPRNMSAAMPQGAGAQNFGQYGLPQWLQQRFGGAQGGGGTGYGMDYPGGGTLPGYPPTTPPGGGYTAPPGYPPATTPPPSTAPQIPGMRDAVALGLGTGNSKALQGLVGNGYTQDQVNQGVNNAMYNNTAQTNADAMDAYRKSIGYKGPVQTW
jgi:hypothetical protein